MSPMRTLLIWFLICCATHIAQAQGDPVLNPDSLHVRGHFPQLHYHWNANTLVHDYSGNWDLDNDGKTDSLFMIGNGGAHARFYPRLVLSAHRQVRTYDWLLVDMPGIGRLDTMGDKGRYYPQFAVQDLDADGAPDIYINFDDRFSSIPAKWRQRGVTSRRVVLSYRNGDMTISNYRTK